MNHTQSFSKNHHNSQLLYPVPLNLIHSQNILECFFSFWILVLISVMSPWAFIFFQTIFKFFKIYKQHF